MPLSLLLSLILYWRIYVYQRWFNKNGVSHRIDGPAMEWGSCSLNQIKLELGEGSFSTYRRRLMGYNSRYNLEISRTHITGVKDKNPEIELFSEDI